jgi:Aspartyl protease
VRKLILVLFLCLNLFLPLLARSANSPDAYPNSTPFALYNGYLIVIEGRISDLPTLHFAIDTGSTRTIIDQHIAASLRLQRCFTTAFNFNKSSRVQSAELPDISFGPQHATHIQVLVADLSYLRATGAKVDVVLGLDLLSQSTLHINFQSRLVSFGEPGAIDPASRHLSSVPLHSNPSSLQVDLNLDGHSIPMILDSGMPGILLYESNLDNFALDPHIENLSAGHSLGGSLDSRAAIVPRLRLGSTDLDRRVRLLRSASSPPLPIAGYLGLSAISAKEVEFDFFRHEFRWKK